MPKSKIPFLKTKKPWPLIIYVFKLSLGIGLFLYFLRSGKLNFDFLTDVNYLIGFLILIGIQILIFLITNYRWFIITKTLELRPLGYKDCLFFSWVGQFFTTFLPAVISADLSKTHYLRQRGFDTVNLLKSVVLDRMISAISVSILFGISVITLILELPILMFCALLVASGLIYYLLRLKFNHLPGKLVKGVFFPPVGTLFISFVSFNLKAFSLIYIAVLAGHSFDLKLFCLSLSGQLIEMFPLTPANLGIGHLAFSYVYGFSGKINGAQIYNFYFIVKLIFKLSGFLGWLLIRKKNLHQIDPNENTA